MILILHDIIIFLGLEMTALNNSFKPICPFQIDLQISILVLVNIKCTTYLFVFSRLFCILYELSGENELLKLLVLVRVTIRSTDRLISRWTLNHVFIFTKQRCKRIQCGLYCQLLCCRSLRHHLLCCPVLRYHLFCCRFLSHHWLCYRFLRHHLLCCRFLRRLCSHCRCRRRIKGRMYTCANWLYIKWTVSTFCLGIFAAEIHTDIL